MDEPASKRPKKLENGGKEPQKHQKPTDSIETPGCVNARSAIRFLTVARSEDVTNPREDDWFHPTFTHQIFEDEKISGYNCLDIQVFLSSSALRCLVRIVGDIDNGNDVLKEQLKDYLPVSFDEDIDSFAASIDQHEADFVPPGRLVHTFEVASKIEEGAGAGAGAGRRRRRRCFEVWAAAGADGGGVESYHARAQTLAMWLIDAASYIDISDERWEVYYLFEKFVEAAGAAAGEGGGEGGEGAAAAAEGGGGGVGAGAPPPGEALAAGGGGGGGRRALAGYFTVFHFQNPVRGCLSRICQALVLPPYQRQGLGSKILNFIYKAMRERDHVSEITVEDPAVGFSQLRDIVDARVCLEHQVFPTLKSDGEGVLNKDFNFEQLEKKVLDHAQKVLKLTVQQIIQSYEVIILKYLDGSDPEMVKKYRLMVKRRLFIEFKSELMNCGDKTERQRILGEMYEDVVKRYNQFIAAI